MIEFLGATAKAEAASGNITLVAPTTPQINDIWIAVIHSSDQVAHTLSGWTQIVQGNGGGSTSRLSVWYFRYAGSTPNLIVTHTGGQSPIGGIAAFRGCRKIGSPVHLAGAISGGTDASIEHSAITPTLRNCAILAISGAADDNARSTLATGYTARFEDSSGGVQNCYLTLLGTPDGSVACHSLLQDAPANTGTPTDVMIAPDPWASVLIALEPHLAETSHLTRRRRQRDENHVVVV
jgi:hypothetical protein